MVEETVVTEPTTGSTEGNVEQPSAHTEETIEASGSPSGQQEILADGIPKDDHRLPLSRVEEIRRQYEDRIAKLEIQLEEMESYSGEKSPASTRPATPEEHPLLSDLKRMYPNESDRLSAETFAKPFIDHISKLEQRIAQTESRAGEMLKMSLEERGKTVYQRFPDLKKASREEQYKMGRLAATLEELGHDDPAKDAYDIVFKDKVKAQFEQEFLEKNKKLNEDKRLLNTMPGIKGTTNSGRPPLPKTEAEWGAYNSWVEKQSKR